MDDCIQLRKVEKTKTFEGCQSEFSLMDEVFLVNQWIDELVTWGEILSVITKI